MRHLEKTNSSTLVQPARVNWRVTQQAELDLVRETVTWLASTDADQLEAYWCAGRATPRSSNEANVEERHFFETFLDALRLALTPAQAQRLTIFFASSAGGVYGDTRHEVASEQASPNPADSYGASKLHLESTLNKFSKETSCRAVIGRITSLYGTEQNPTKPQGLLGHVANSVATGRPFHLFASLATTRNYLDVDTAARIAVTHVRTQSLSSTLLRNICAAHNVSIAEVLTLARQLSGRRVLVRQVALERAANSRIETRYPHEVVSISRTTLVEGMAQLVRAARLRLLTPTATDSSTALSA